MYDQYMYQSFPRKQVEKVGEIYSYTVEKGDNLYQIARMFNTKMEMIANLNQMNVNDQLHVNQQLYIPVVTAVPFAERSVEAPMYRSVEMANPYDSYF